jgi:hypothetical protein
VEPSLNLTVTTAAAPLTASSVEATPPLAASPHLA